MKMTEEQKEAKRLAKVQAKEMARIESEKNQKPVKSIEISIEWKHSRTWGNCPRATARVYFQDGSFIENDGFYASGCGYDKESTVISEIFREYLLYKLWVMDEDTIKTNSPYGISGGDTYRGFSYGIGTDCYYSISEFIGGKLEHIASGKTFDAYKYTDNL